MSVLDCGPLIEELERDLGLSVEITARALSVDRRTIERWRTNQSAPQGKARERLGELLALRKRLLAQFGTPDGTREWLHAPSLYLGGSTRWRPSKPVASTGSKLILTALRPASSCSTDSRTSVGRPNC